MTGYLHITKSKGICCCVLSEDINARNVLKYETKKYDNFYQMGLECIARWKKIITETEITRIIIISDKRSIYQHIKRCEKRKKEIYEFEKEARKKINVELYIAIPILYSKALRFCKKEYCNE